MAASLINFGNITTANGRTILGGSQTGLDTSAIIETLVQAKRLPATKFEDTITVNDSKITALTEMKSMLNSLKNSVNTLRKPSGFSSSSTNIFEARNTFMSMSSGGTATNYIGIAASSGAPIGDYQIEVTNLAVAQSNLSESFSSLTASVVVNDLSGGPTTGKFEAGTFDINYNDENGDPQTQTITLTAGSNLATVRDAINLQADTTGVRATIIKLSESDYRLKLYADETGTDNAFTFTNNTGTAVNFTTTAAENATIEFDGEEVIRQSNVIDDLIANTTITLYQETAGETITLDIDKDNQQVAEGIAGFLDSYNTFRLFGAQQTEIDEDGVYKDTAYLHDNPVFTTIRNKLALLVGGAKGAGLVSPTVLAGYRDPNAALPTPTSLADLGIYFDTQAAVSGEEGSPEISNILRLDADQLNKYLEKYFSKTRELFEFSFTSDNADLSLFKRSNVISDNDIASFTVTLDHTLGTATLTNIKDSNGVDVDPSTLTMDYELSGTTVSITGQSGTIMEGMEFFYTGTISGTSTANVTTKQGVGDTVFNSLSAYIDGIDGYIGAIDQEIESLQTQNESAQASIDRIDLTITSYRDQLLDRFAALEALVAASNQTLTLLDAQASARNNS